MKNKTSLVLKREYLSRVKKKSFILMTVLSPILFAGFFAFVGWMATKKDTSEKKIAVIDDTYLFQETLKNTETLTFDFAKDKTVQDFRENFDDSGYYAVLYIDKAIKDGNAKEGVKLFSNKKISLSVQSYIEKSIESKKLNELLNNVGIDKDVIDKAKEDSNISIITRQWDGDEEKKSSSEIATALAFGCGILIFMFVLMYGIMVMRGIIEEKSNRIVEVIVSSVKPFQLMMGKIIGIALVGLTQFAIWVILTGLLVMVGMKFIMPEVNTQANTEVTQTIIDQAGGMTQGMPEVAIVTEQNQFMDIIESIGNFEWGFIIFAFLFYFIGGYLLYAAIFAIIGAAVDNETDTQQFMFPVMIPLYIGFYAMFNIIKNPDTAMADWLSIIPFTSPVVMLARIPFGMPPLWQILLSMGLLILTFVGATWFAGKIYRTGILMYGKKPSYKEIWKWFRYKS
jgi:ABC-2 type transport system permease protein